MPRDEAELVRLAFDLFAETGSDWEALHQPDLVVIPPPGWPEAEVLRDRAAWMRQARRLSEDWEEARFEIDELQRLGDGRTLALFRWRTRGKGSQIEFETPFGLILTIRDGLIGRYEFFGSYEDARRAAGVPG